MNVLGISCYFHDAAAALVRDGALVAAAEEERFSRIKHDFSFPSSAIRFCLTHLEPDAGALDYVAFFEKPFVKFERILQTVIASAPKTGAVFRQAMTSWLLDKLWVRNRISQEVGIDASRILFVPHHLSHAASAFFCSPFDRAAILTVDGVGEWSTTSMGVGEASTCSLTDEIRFPHSIGLLYSAFTAFLGFEVNEGEYKVMGMAPYGEPRFVDQVWRVVKPGAGGSFELDHRLLLVSVPSAHGASRRSSSSSLGLRGVPTRRFSRVRPAIRRTSGHLRAMSPGSRLKTSTTPTLRPASSSSPRS